MDAQTATLISLGLTAALIGVTGYYAWQNRRMVLEMREARLAQTLPRLRPTVYGLGAGLGRLRVVNVGPGPAIDVDVELRLEPGDEWSVRWTASVVAPGEKHDFWPHASADPASNIMRIPEIAEKYQHLVLTGTMRDVAGATHRVDERFDIREWWQLIIQAGRQLDKDWAEETAKHLQEIAKELKSFNTDRRSERLRSSLTWRDRIGWRRERYEAQLRARVDAVMRSLGR